MDHINIDRNNAGRKDKQMSLQAFGFKLNFFKGNSFLCHKTNNA